MRAPRSVAVLLGTLVVAAPLVAVASPAVAADADIRINEVESNDDTTDWIEVVNTGTDPVDISGWIVKDNNDARTDAIAAGTVVAPGAFYVIEEPAISFGLGAADVARVFLPDGTTLIDSYSWTAHSPTTYGRNPDGIGDFAVTAASTKGASNSFAVDPADVLRINEIESDGGVPGDWVELVNSSAFEVDASGLVVADSASQYVLPAGTTIAADDYLVIEEAALGFGLGGADSARLLAADGVTVIDEYSWLVHATTTYGRCPDTVGGFQATLAPTKDAVNECTPPAGADILVNEVESSGGTPGDWAEFFNPGATAVDVGGWIVRDNDNTEAVVIPTGTVIAAGGYLAVDVDIPGGFGLGANDEVRIFLPDGVTLIDRYSWNTLGHAPTTYGLNPATGLFEVTTASTKGAANRFGPPVLINEIESDGGTPGDWVELANSGESTADASGLILRDSNDASELVLPAGTSIESGGYLVVDVAAQFGLGSGDTVRLFDADGTTLLDSYTWTEHATTTYGRCPDITGDFVTTLAPTRGLINACEIATPATPWPGSPDVAAADRADTFGEDLSGLAYEAGAASDVLWAVENGNGRLYRLVFDGTNWVPDSGDWINGSDLRYPDGTGTVDAEGVGLAAGGSAGGVYVSSERNNDADEVSRPSVLRYDVSGPATELVATREWNLASALPVLTANGGLEGISWIPDTALVASGFVDETTGAAYDPADYPAHGDGLFFVGVETDGNVYGFSLNDDGSFDLVATIISGFELVAELEYDAASGALLVVCDDACDGQITRFEVGDSGAFEPVVTYARPADMPNIANEGFALAPQCVNGARAAFWADDADTEGFSIRVGTFACTAAGGPGTGTGDPGTGTGGAGAGAGDDTGTSGTGTSGTGTRSLAATGADAAAPVTLAMLLLLAGLTLVIARARRTAGLGGGRTARR